MRKAIVEISSVLLKEILKFPPGTEIIGVRASDTLDFRSVEFMVTHPDLPEVPEMCHARKTNPVYRQATVELPHEFVSWGL